jgi:hypothetical protein
VNNNLFEYKINPHYICANKLSINFLKMPSIKFTAAELEFLVGQYELELIEAEKYVGEVKNILKKLGVISKDNPGKNELKKKRGRGRPARVSVNEGKIPAEKKEESPKKKKGKPGRPKKRGPEKGSKPGVATAPKPVETKVPEVKAAALKPAKKKPALPVKEQTKKEVKPVVVKAAVKASAKKKQAVKKQSASKAKSARQPKPALKVKAQATVIETPPAVPAQDKPAEA